MVYVTQYAPGLLQDDRIKFPMITMRKHGASGSDDEARYQLG